MNSSAPTEYQRPSWTRTRPLEGVGVANLLTQLVGHGVVLAYIAVIVAGQAAIISGSMSGRQGLAQDLMSSIPSPVAHWGIV